MTFQDAMYQAIRGHRVQMAGCEWFVIANPLDRVFRKVRNIPGMKVEEVYAPEQGEIEGEWEVRE